MTTATETRERPILFSGDMVRAILEGRKTQTRRVIKPQPEQKVVAGGYCWFWKDRYAADLLPKRIVKYCPYGKPGDVLWVRETWANTNDYDGQKLMDRRKALYRADQDGIEPERWRPAIHMPRWACRLTLDVTDIRVERVQDIDDIDAKHEGMHPDSWYEHASSLAAYRDQFAALWDDLNAKRGFGWDTNPWVWVVEFKKT